MRPSLEDFDSCDTAGLHVVDNNAFTRCMAARSACLTICKPSQELDMASHRGQIQLHCMYTLQ